MLRTGAYLVAIFGTIFGGAYALDRLAKHKEKMIEKQEFDEVELEDFEEDVCEDFCWYEEMWNEVMEDFGDCLKERPCSCGHCKCNNDADGDHECCGNCKCNEEDEENK